MKTYWLEGRENRTPITKDIKTKKPVEIEGMFEEIDDSRTAGYSPITFREIARRSIANSPIKYVFTARGKQKFESKTPKTNTKHFVESRSNSAGCVFPRTDPADVFGSIICNNELNFTISESFDPSSSTNDYTFQTSSPQKDKFASEISLTSQSSLNFKATDESLSSENKSKAANPKLLTDDVDEKKVPKKSMSVDDHLSNRLAQFSKEAQQKMQHNHQCCSGFGAGNRRFHSDACSVM